MRPLTRRSDCGRYWDRTSDLFGASLCQHRRYLSSVVGWVLVGPGCDLSEESAVGVGPAALDCRVALERSRFH
jgi:hypothetical protein